MDMKYGEQQYWENRYKTNLEEFDWYQRWPTLKTTISKYIKKESNILQIGCGTSRLSEDMVNDGYQNLTNIDISSVAINYMSNKYKNMSQLSFIKMDVFEMAFSDTSFDAIIDKGTFDALLCCDDPMLATKKMIQEVFRVLKSNSPFVMITHGNESDRIKYLENFNWTIEATKIQKALNAEEFHYIFICTKK